MENYKILLVEDDGSLIDGLEYSLKKDGFLVDIARNVQEFLHIYEKGKYDLLLLDVTLPDGHGFEICEKVRKESEVPILFLTAADEEFNVVRGLDMGGDDYVSKPFRLNELLSRIHSPVSYTHLDVYKRQRYILICMFFLVVPTILAICTSSRPVIYFNSSAILYLSSNCFISSTRRW